MTSLAETNKLYLLDRYDVIDPEFLKENVGYHVLLLPGHIMPESFVEEHGGKEEKNIFPEFSFRLDRRLPFIFPRISQEEIALAFSKGRHAFNAILIVDSQTSNVHHETSANATTQKEPPLEARKELKDLLGQAKEEVFEDGMESEFSKKLAFFIGKYGNDAIDLLTEWIASEQINPEIAAEALKTLSRLEDVSTYQSRFWLLQRSLRCSYPLVRYVAAMGLASLDDPQAIPSLEAALKDEMVEELREDMEQALADLKASDSCLFS